MLCLIAPFEFTSLRDFTSSHLRIPFPAVNLSYHRKTRRFWPKMPAPLAKGTHLTSVLCPASRTRTRRLEHFLRIQTAIPGISFTNKKAFGNRPTAVLTAFLRSYHLHLHPSRRRLRRLRKPSSPPLGRRIPPQNRHRPALPRRRDPTSTSLNLQLQLFLSSFGLQFSSVQLQ
jgi:hypothetical protein